MRRIGRVWSTVALAVVAFAASGFAATPAQDAKHAIGTIQGYDAKRATVELKIGSSLEVFKLEKSTAIADHGTTIPAAQLRKGERVDVAWQAKDGHSVAERIDVLGSTTQSSQKGR